jgi:hypothetical protein
MPCSVGAVPGYRLEVQELFQVVDGVFGELVLLIILDHRQPLLEPREP